MTSGLIKRGRLVTQGNATWAPRMAITKPQRQAWTSPSFLVFRTVHALILGIWPPEEWENTFCCLWWSHSGWVLSSCSPNNLIHTTNRPTISGLEQPLLHEEQTHGRQGWREVAGWTGRLGLAYWHIHTTGAMYKVGNWWEPTVQLRELYSVLCSPKWEENTKKRGHMYMYIYMYHTADSLCCTVGTNSASQSNYTTIKIHYKRKKEYPRFHLFLTLWVSSLVWACPSFTGLTRDSSYRCGHLQLDQGRMAKDGLAHKSGSWCWLSGGTILVGSTWCYIPCGWG